LTRQPFLGVEAVSAGVLTKDHLRSSAWRRLFHGVYADSRLPVGHKLLVQGAALLLPPDAAVAGRSAAHLYGAQLADADLPVTVACPRRWRAAAGIRVVRRALEPAQRRTFGGVPVTTPLATAYELARSLPLEDAVVWLDALGRVRALRPRDLRDYTAAQRGSRDWRQATRAVELTDPRAESPPESRVRLLLALAGLPTPVPQYAVLYQGEFVARVDLAWPQFKIALEYDGQWHADSDQLTRDRRRVRDLNALGWYVYPVTSADVRDPTGLVAQVRALLCRHGAG
jgi:hypothetical protein